MARIEKYRSTNLIVGIQDQGGMAIQHSEILHLLLVRGILLDDCVLRFHPIPARFLVTQDRTWTRYVPLGNMMPHVAFGEGFARCRCAHRCRLARLATELPLRLGPGLVLLGSWRRR